MMNGMHQLARRSETGVERALDSLLQHLGPDEGYAFESGITDEDVPF